MTKAYRPRRAGGAWLVGAPEYVLDCRSYGNPGDTGLRFQVLLGDVMWQPSMDRNVRFLSFTHRGATQGWRHDWGRMPTTLPRDGERILWCEIPLWIQERVKALVRAELRGKK